MLKNRRQALVAAGAVSTVLVAREILRRVGRRLVEAVDPVAPAAAEARALLEPPLTCEDVEAFVRETKPTTEGAAKSVTWATRGLRRPTEFSVVYVHGWAACRQEIAPTPQLLARALGANLYCHRLSGHGRRREESAPASSPDGDILLREATPGRLFRDALEALRVGRALGDRVILVGVSTGAALCTWLAATEAADDVAALVLVSPCFGLGHPLYPLLKIPFAALRLLPAALCRPVRAAAIALLLGPTKRVLQRGAEHARFNALVYPQAALLHLLDVLFSLERVDVARVAAPTFVALNERDPVIDVARAAALFHDLGSNKMLYCHELDCGDPHVLASQMLSPASVDAIADAAILFVRAHLGRGHGLERRRSGAELRRGASYGPFGSFTGLDGLTRPFPF